MKKNIYSEGLDACMANFVPLTPLSFLDRSAEVFPNRAAVVHGELVQTWKETRDRCYRLASALVKRNVKPNDTVSIIAPNTPAMLEAHFGIPLSGAVLNCINCRLDADAIAFILQHGESRLLLVDREFAEVTSRALKKVSNPPLVIDIADKYAPEGPSIGDIEYEDLLNEGNPAFEGVWPEDENSAIALNYTSGTTGDPKGVVPSHRGTYLMSILQVTNWALPNAPVYLWTLPMFHANGWCFTWAITAAAGAHICLRKVTASNIFNAIVDHGVTHFCAAPVVLSTIANASNSERRILTHKVSVLTAGSAPPAEILHAVKELGLNVDHVYGITEASGTPVSCAWQGEWNELPDREQARLKARQGVRAAMMENLRVANPKTLEPVPFDGITTGEVLMRGNYVMKGYLKNEKATKIAFEGGWFHTGDVAVVHPNGYFQIKDRSKDVIISGGENISSIEVEDILHSHRDVLLAAVVAQPDDKWGEVPCAFIELKPNAKDITEADIIQFCRDRMAHFKCPRHIVFCTLPKTATGKIQKFMLRKEAGSKEAITRLAE